MYYPEKHRALLPNVDTTWGTWTSPHIAYNPEDYITRAFPIPGAVRGSARPGGPFPTSIGSRYMGDVATDSKWGLIILLGVIGLVAFLAGRASEKGTKHNPRRRRRLRRASHRRLRAAAHDRPRDDQGRFL